MRLSRIPAGVALLVAVAVSVAGCGGSAKPGVAHLSSTTSPGAPGAASGGNAAADTASPQQEMVAFARCMRTHGLPGFPEPVEGHLTVRAGQGIRKGSPQFEGALKACRGLAPEGGPHGGLSAAERQRRAAGLLAFARCMRARGISTFPDPTSQGELSVEAVEAAGVDVHAPDVQAAASACLPASDGALTAAEVKRAESGGH